MRRRGDSGVVCCMRVISTCAILFVLCACGSSAPPTTTTVTIESIPNGANIMIDGTDYGLTPVTIPDLDPGEHYVILELRNHKRLDERFTLEVDTPLELELTLAHHSGRVTFTSRPEGARVYIKTDDTNELVGETPLENFELKTGTYSYEMILENHHPIERGMVIKNGEYYTEAYSLKAMIARLQIFSRPTGAQVWINDEERPEKTPANVTLVPGEYTVGVYMSGYMIDEQAVILEPNSTITVNAVLKEGDMPLGMVLVPAGEFVFGDNNNAPDEKPVRKISLDAFYIDKHEVTNAQFKNVFPGHTFIERQDNYPVRGLTWKQAADYATAVGKRLPTEMEWEKAARGASGRNYPWGRTFEKGLANIASNISSDVEAVGSHKKGVSEYGCYDMSGNVYEWVGDWYNKYPGNTEIKAHYGSVYRVLRGGSYKSDRFESRSAKRHYDKPESNREDYGFRCAKNADL